MAYCTTQCTHALHSEAIQTEGRIHQALPTELTASEVEEFPVAIPGTLAGHLQLMVTGISRNKNIHCVNPAALSEFPLITIPVHVRSDYTVKYHRKCKIAQI